MKLWNRDVPVVVMARSLRFLNNKSNNATSDGSNVSKHALAISNALCISTWVVVCSMDHPKRRLPTRFAHNLIAEESANSGYRSWSPAWMSWPREHTKIAQYDTLFLRKILPVVIICVIETKFEKIPYLLVEFGILSIGSEQCQVPRKLPTRKLRRIDYANLDLIWGTAAMVASPDRVLDHKQQRTTPRHQIVIAFPSRNMA